jgi:iron complex transport system substrate-binding protein
VSVTLLVVAVLLVAGAAIVATATYYDLRPAASPLTGPGHVAVVDDLGRTVTAPANASRIVVLAPSVMDLVFRLGLRDRVVGIGCTVGIAGGIQNEYSPNQTTAWNLSASLCVTDFPTLDTEKIANLSTQLVLASTLTYASDVQELTDVYHIPVILLAPSTLDGVVGDVALAAQLFPASASSATGLEAELRGILYNATTFDSNLSTTGAPIPSVLLTYYFDPGGYYTYGPGSFGQSIIDLAGGSSVSTGVPLVYAEINATVVLNDNPRVLIFGTSWNDPFLVSNETPTAWAGAPYWAQLNGTKVAIDVTLLTEAGPSMILELPWYLHWLHPTLVPAPRT